MSTGKLDERLKMGEDGKGKDKAADDVELQSELAKALHDDDMDLARDLQRSRAQLIIAQRRKLIETETGKGNGGGNGDGSRVKSEDYLITVTSGLLDKGLDPKVVGQIVQSLIGGGAQNIPLSMGTGQQGMTVKDVKDIFEIAKTDKGTDPTLLKLLEKIDTRLAAVEGGAGNNREVPKTYIYREDPATGQFKREALEPGSSMVIPAPRTSDPGKSIEQLKEENRHAEEKERIRVEENYKVGLVTTLGDVFERAGRGIAAQMMDSPETPAGGPPAAPKDPSQTKMRYLKCDNGDCGFNIPIPPGVARVKCPKCGMVYSSDPKDWKDKGPSNSDQGNDSNQTDKGNGPV
jgi:hypothetical protein